MELVSLIGYYFIKNQDKYKVKQVKIKFEPNHLSLKDTWSGKQTEIAVSSKQEIKYRIIKAHDVSVDIQIFVNVDGIKNYIEIDLNSKNESIISNYFEVPEISISIETINIRKINFAKNFLITLGWPVLLGFGFLLFSSIGLESAVIALLGLLFSLLISVPIYIKLNRRQNVMILEKEK